MLEADKLERYGMVNDQSMVMRASNLDTDLAFGILKAS